MGLGSDMEQLIGQRIAIHCAKQSDASAFIATVLEEYEGVRERWSAENILWERNKSRTAYTLRLDRHGIPRMYYGSVEWYRNNGYDTVEYEDFANELEESELPISLLLEC